MAAKLRDEGHDAEALDLENLAREMDSRARLEEEQNTCSSRQEQDGNRDCDEPNAEFAVVTKLMAALLEREWGQAILSASTDVMQHFLETEGAGTEPVATVLDWIEAGLKEWWLEKRGLEQQKVQLQGHKEQLEQRMAQLEQLNMELEEQNRLMLDQNGKLQVQNRQVQELGQSRAEEQHAASRKEAASLDAHREELDRLREALDAAEMATMVQVYSEANAMAPLPDLHTAGASGEAPRRSLLPVAPASELPRDARGEIFDRVDMNHDGVLDCAEWNCAIVKSQEVSDAPPGLRPHQAGVAGGASGSKQPTGLSAIDDGQADFVALPPRHYKSHPSPLPFLVTPTMLTQHTNPRVVLHGDSAIPIGSQMVSCVSPGPASRLPSRSKKL